MPKKRKTFLSKQSSKAKKVKVKKQNETEDERENRLLAMRNRNSLLRRNESDVERENRLQELQQRTQNLRNPPRERSRGFSLVIYNTKVSTANRLHFESMVLFIHVLRYSSVSSQLYKPLTLIFWGNVKETVKNLSIE